MKKSIINCAAHLLVATWACDCFSSNETNGISIGVGRGDKSDNVGQDNTNILSDVGEKNDDGRDFVVSPLTTDEQDSVSSYPSVLDNNRLPDSSNGCAASYITNNGVKRPIPVKGYLPTVPPPVKSNDAPVEMLAPSISKEERFRRIAGHLVPDDMLFNRFNGLYKTRREMFLKEENNPDLTLYDRFYRTLRYLESALILCQEILGIPKTARLDIEDFCEFLEYLDRTGGVASISRDVCDRLCNVLKEVCDDGILQHMMRTMDDSDALPKEPIIVTFQSLENEHPGASMRLSSDLVQCHVSPDGAQILPAWSQISPAWAHTPLCGAQFPSAWAQVPPYGAQVPSPYGAQVPPYGAQVPPYGAQVPSPYGAQVPSPYGAQVPPYGAQVPPYGAQVPPYGAQVPPPMAQVSPDMEQVSPDMEQVPPAMARVSPYKVQIPLYRVQVSPDMEQVSPYKVQIPPYKVQIPLYRVQVSPDMEQVSPYKVQIPPYRAQVPPAMAQFPSAWAQVPPYGAQVPSPYGAQVPPYGAQVPIANFSELPANAIVIGSSLSRIVVGGNGNLRRVLLSLDVIRDQFGKAAVHANNIRAAITRRDTPIVYCHSPIEKRRADSDLEGQSGVKKARTTED